MSGISAPSKPNKRNSIIALPDAPPQSGDSISACLVCPQKAFLTSFAVEAPSCFTTLFEKWCQAQQQSSAHSQQSKQHSQPSSHTKQQQRTARQDARHPLSFFCLGGGPCWYMGCCWYCIGGGPYIKIRHISLICWKKVVTC